MNTPPIVRRRSSIGKGGSQIRPVRPPELRSVIRSWQRLTPAVLAAISRLADVTARSIASPPGVVIPPAASIVPPSVPGESLPINPEDQALFDGLTSHESVLFGDRWFYSGRPCDRFIQGSPAGQKSPQYRFDGTTLQMRDGSGWLIIRVADPATA